MTADVRPVTVLPNGAGAVYDARSSTGAWAYRVVVAADGTATCSCPARTADCRHVAAVRDLPGFVLSPSDAQNRPNPARATRKPLDAANQEGSPMTHEDDPEALDGDPGGPVAADPPVDVELVDGPPVVDAQTVALTSETTAQGGDVDVLAAGMTWRTVTAVAQTDFVPRELRGKPAAVLAVILWGRDLGVEPMEALRAVDWIDGRPSPSAELLVRLYRERGHRLEVVELDGERCEVEGTRGDTGETMRASFTIEDATRAGLVARSKAWTAYPDDLLFWRASARLIRRLAPDVLSKRGS